MCCQTLSSSHAWRLEVHQFLSLSFHSFFSVSHFIFSIILFIANREIGFTFFLLFFFFCVFPFLSPSHLSLFSFFFDEREEILIQGFSDRLSHIRTCHSKKDQHICSYLILFSILVEIEVTISWGSHHLTQDTCQKCYRSSVPLFFSSGYYPRERLIWFDKFTR
jgi:hypothetical protein